jgi:fermentation-respiration switch protein FrsA (DUF1100 family)
VDAAVSKDQQEESPKKAWTLWRKFKWTVRILVLLILAAMLMHGCDGRFYYPDHAVYYTPAELSLDVEPVSFRTDDGVKLSAWFVKTRAPQPLGTVIHFHGNAQNLTSHILHSMWLTSEGYQVLIFDYRGYGKSQGSVTREGTIRDGHAALDYCLGRPDVDPKRIFAYGQSLGGAVATVVASERPEVAAVILESTFGDYREIAAEHLRQLVGIRALADWLSTMLVSDGYDPIDYVAKIAPRPLLCFTSADDAICYAHLGRALYDAAGEPKEYVEVKGAGHLNMQDVAGYEYQRRVLDFLKRAAPP